LNFLILGVLPYLTVLIFVIGMAYRLYVWSKTPQPGALTLFPAPKPESGLFWGVLKESFLFPGLFKGDKLFWGFSWFFHASLALIAIGHLRVFTGLIDSILVSFGVNVDLMSSAGGGVAGIVIMIAAILLISRRLTMKRVREISGFPDFFALLLITAIIVTGNWMRFGAHFDLAQTRVYFSALLTFSYSAAVAPASGMFVLHFLLAQFLIILIPFSKIMHFGGVFFTQAVIQKS